MENIDTLILNLAYLLIVGGIITILFKKIRQPLVLGYIVGGFLVSPYFPYIPSIIQTEDITVWGDLGIIFLMFALGLEFSFHRIANLGGSAIITAATVIAAMIGAGYLLGHSMGWESMDCIFLGGMISMSSTSIILKVYDEMHLKKKRFAELVMGVLVLEDIAGVFMMIILSTISVSRNVNGWELTTEIGILLLYLVLWLVLGIYLIPSFLKKADRFMNEETLLIVSIGLCLGMVVLANLIGFSSALGAFVAGSILAGTVKAEQIEALTKPIKDLFGAVFFMTVGMMVMPSMLIRYALPILLISFVVILGTNLFATIGVLLAGQDLYTAVRAGFSLVQIGEFSFIIATLGTGLGVTSDFLYPVIVCVSVITTFFTPMFIRGGEAAYQLYRRILPDKLVRFLSRYTSEGQVDHDKDNDWKNYLKKYFLRTVICMAALCVIYLVYVQQIEPMVSGNVQRWIELLLILVLMSPFISILCSTRRNLLYKKLWTKHPANRLPLVAFFVLRLVIAMLFIFLALRRTVEIPAWIAITAAVLLLFVIGRSQFLKGATLDLQARFYANFNERTLAKRKGERERSGTIWVDEQLYVLDPVITELSQEGMTISELVAKRVYGVTVIKIRRGAQYIVMPQADTLLRTGDVIHVTGTREQLASYRGAVQNAAYLDDAASHMLTLRDYISNQTEEGLATQDEVMLCAIEVLKGGRFAGKQVKNCGFREKFGGYILALEKGDMTMLSPNVLARIEAGNILWVIGSREMAESLYTSGYLNGENGEA